MSVLSLTGMCELKDPLANKILLAFQRSRKDKKRKNNSNNFQTLGTATRTRDYKVKNQTKECQLIPYLPILRDPLHQ